MDVREMTVEQRRALYETVLLFASRLTRSEERAEELTQEAFLRLLTTRRWDPKKQPSLERHLFGIVKSLRWAGGKATIRKYEEEAGHEQALLSGGAAPSAETTSIDHAKREREKSIAAQRAGALRAKLAGHDLELSICDLMADDDVAKRSHLAQRLGRSAGEVDKALRRIRRYMNSIVAADGGEDEEV